MKPVAIFRHTSGEGPGYFATFLDAHSIPWTLFAIDAGTAPVIATITDTTTTPANIVAVDVRASNGVIHVINKVLLPNLGN